MLSLRVYNHFLAVLPVIVKDGYWIPIGHLKNLSANSVGPRMRCLCRVQIDDGSLAEWPKVRLQNNNLAPILNFVLFHCNLCLNTKALKKFWLCMGDVRLFRVVTGTKKNFQQGQNFFLQIIYDPFIFATDNFSEIQSITSTGWHYLSILGPNCRISLVHGLTNFKDTKSKCRLCWRLEVHPKSYLKRQIKGGRLH